MWHCEFCVRVKARIPGPVFPALHSDTSADDTKRSSTVLAGTSVNKRTGTKKPNMLTVATGHAHKNNYAKTIIFT